jgi:hypothetical protein
MKTIHRFNKSVWLRSLALYALLSAPGSIIVGLSFTVFVGSKVPHDVALATYSGQIQLCAIFAALAPFSFAFFRNTNPSQRQMRAAATLALLEIVFSLLGIAYSFANMISERLDFPSVAVPFFPPAVAAAFLLFFLLTAMGRTRRILEWVGAGAGPTNNQNQGTPFTSRESQSSYKYQVWVAGVTGAIVAAMFDFFVIRRTVNGLEGLVIRVALFLFFSFVFVTVSYKPLLWIAQGLDSYSIWNLLTLRWIRKSIRRGKDDAE